MTARRTGGRSAGRFSGQGVVAVADTSGRFAIEVPSPGGWSVTASAHGYHTQALDAHEGYSTAIVVSEATPTAEVIFPLPPASAIQGYVVDEGGEPVRNGQLTLSLIPPANPEKDHPRQQVHGIQRTDDRGYYKFSGLSSGIYEIRLQAQPWYASSGPGQRFVHGGIVAIAGRISVDGAASSSTATPDPLDVVYPTVWYPGVAEFSEAMPLTLRAGEVREADFRLSPIPGFHLRIAAPSSQNDQSGRTAFQGGTYLSQILPDGGETSVPIGMQEDGQGNMEFSGLAPGTYQVHRQGELASGALSTATIQISPNSSRTVDMSGAASATRVAVRIDAAADLPSLQITFQDLDTGRTSSVQSSTASDFRGAWRRGPVADANRGAEADQAPNKSMDRSINLPPGRYEVSLSGINDLHMSGIEATGATATGRTVTIGGGVASLMLHVAGGRANVSGFVRQEGSASSGSMVLLVPASLGDPAGLAVVRRDQSNTDGSFDLLNVLPGPYILIAIDHGWEVNWRDPSTLRHFLMHGVPLDLSAGGDHKMSVEAQSP